MGCQVLVEKEDGGFDRLDRVRFTWKEGLREEEEEEEEESVRKPESSL